MSDTSEYEQKVAFYHNNIELKPFFGTHLPSTGDKIQFSTISSIFRVLEIEYIYDYSEGKFVDVRIHLQEFKSSDNR